MLSAYYMLRTFISPLQILPPYILGVWNSSFSIIELHYSFWKSVILWFLGETSKKNSKSYGFYCLVSFLSFITSVILAYILLKPEILKVVDLIQLFKHVLSALVLELETPRENDSVSAFKKLAV